jgi:hypothetical protein
MGALTRFGWWLVISSPNSQSTPNPQFTLSPACQSSHSRSAHRITIIMQRATSLKLLVVPSLPFQHNHHYVNYLARQGDNDSWSFPRSYSSRFHSISPFGSFRSASTFSPPQRGYKGTAHRENSVSLRSVISPTAYFSLSPAHPHEQEMIS